MPTRTRPAKRAAAAPKAKAPAKAPRRTPAEPAKAARPTPAKGRTAKKPTAPKPAVRKAPTAARRASAETEYSGRTFRSRLEARWAVLFDLLGLDWDYEVAWFPVGEGLGYLPDFYLPGPGLWVEVKGHAYLDAGSMAKILAAAAGPAPLPSRIPPYGPSGRLLLAGPLEIPGDIAPQHTLVTASRPGTAALAYATLAADGLIVSGPAWDEVPADGVARPRRPSPTRTRTLLEPPASRTPLDPDMRRAYQAAATVAFDDAGRLSRLNPAWLLAELSLRRAGRPLAQAA